MRIKQAIPKFVNGEPVSNQEFNDAIADAIDQRGFAKPIQIASDLGWTNSSDEKRAVARQMNNMLGQGWLTRSESGFYSLATGYRVRRGRTLEAGILDVIRSYGGLARWKEIMNEFDTLPSANSDVRPYEGRGGGSQANIWKAMTASKKIVHYELFLNEIMWGLPWNELLQVPLTGRNAEFVMKLQFVEPSTRLGPGGQDAQVDLFSNIDEHFERVGRAFAKVRDILGLDFSDVVSRPPVKKALEWVKLKSPEITRRIYADVRTTAKRRANEEGRPNDEYYIERLVEQEATQFLAHMLAHFEYGDPAIHRLAPASLYYAYADQFGVCAASLSRGVVAKPLTPAALPDGWERMPGAYGEPTTMLPTPGYRRSLHQKDYEN